MSEGKPCEVGAVLWLENFDRPCVRNSARFGMKVGVGKIYRGKIVVSLHDFDATFAHQCHTFVRIPPVPDNISQAVDFVDSKLVYESQSLLQSLKIRMNIRKYG
jgi:hypothetical protein